MSVMIARFDGATDNTAGKAIKVTWPDLAFRLSQFKQSENKKAIGGWMPVVYRPICNCGEENCPGDLGHRTNDNVLEVYALAFDLDKTREGEPLDQQYADSALQRLQDLKLRHVVHTTHSHSAPDRIALRVVVAISRPVRGHEWETFWAAAVKHIDIHVEPVCRNLGRFWFLPSSKPGAEAWSRSVDGEPLDVKAMLASAHQASAPATTENADRDYTQRETQFDINAWRALVQRYEPGAKEKRKRSRISADITCPWESEHSSSSPLDTVTTFGDDGKPTFSCLHSHCSHRHWQDFRAYVDPDYAAWRANGFKATPEWIERQRRENPRSDQQARAEPEPGGQPADELKAKRERKKREPRPPSGPSDTGHAGLGEKGGYRFTDLGNARRFADQNNNQLRYVKSWNQWLAWDGKRWTKDSIGTETQAAKQVVQKIYSEVAELSMRAAKAVGGIGPTVDTSMLDELGKWATASAKAPRISAMIQLAASEPELATAPSVWDQDVWLLNCSNGTIDLRTGELRAHQQLDQITMLAPVDYDPNAQAPRFLEFLSRVQPDEETRAWIQRYLGYALTGDVREQCLAFFYGGGSNGKNVLLDIVLDILGSYGLRAAPDLVLAKQGEAHPTELADLESKRLVVCSEIEQGKAWAESLIKRITGDRTITARKMRQDFYTFPATHKIVVAANTRPAVRGTDHGIWRRMRLVPWSVTIPDSEQDKTLPDQLLQEEGSGILAWLVRGCIAWQNRTLGTAQAIEEATHAYRTGEDVIGRWIEDRCELGECWDGVASLFASFKSWCEEEGITPWKRKTWRDRVLERAGITDGVRDSGKVRALIGIKVRGLL